MTTWQEFANDAPELSSAVRARFEAAKHHVLATLRRDGSPRVSGIGVGWHGADLVFGSMVGAVKARDLQRDGRFSLHAHPGDGSLAGGDAKLSGRAVEVVDADELRAFYEKEDPPGDSHLFRIDLSEAVLTEIGEDEQHLLIKLWRPARGVVAYRRYD
jgi:hypothetical protein